MQRVQTDSFVTIRFTQKSRLADGTEKKHPPQELEFIFGTERQVPSLERALSGAREGDRFNVSVPPKELYGERDQTLVREIPRAGLIKQRLREGCYYRQMKKGCLVAFKVLALNADSVVADFNPPMAGIAAELEVEVISVRPASAEEISAARESQAKKLIGCG